MRELGIAMDFKAKTITIDEVTLPVIASIICKKNDSTLRVQKLNNNLAKEPISIQVANKRATRKLDTKDKKADLQSIVQDNCKHLNANPQITHCSFSLKMSCFLMAP
jgi:hypothetical protein